MNLKKNKANNRKDQAQLSESESESNFLKKVLKIVRRIPWGKILTYGQVATIAGSPRASRIVGGILFWQGPWSKLPWQRVINAQGKISTYRVGCGEKQRALLEGEGLVFRKDDSIDLKKYQWRPTVREVNKWKL